MSSPKPIIVRRVLPADPMRSRVLLSFGLLLVGVVFFAILTLLFGSVDFAMRDVLYALWSPSRTSPLVADIVLNLRVPRVAAAMLGGAALSLSGLLLQTIFRNPLAGPYVLGVSSGASLGVALVLLAGWGAGNAGLLGAAGVGAASVLAAVLLLSRWVRTPASLLVLGLMTGYLVDALISVLIHFSDSEALRSFVTWGFGSFARLQLAQIPWFAGAVGFSLLLVLVCLKYLNAMAIGEEGARALGIEVDRSRRIVLVAASLLAAASTAFCGPIGFIGMAVPHLARGLFRTANHRVLVPASMVMGALLALLAGWIAQFPGGAGNLPLNAVTSIMGAPVVIWILFPGQARKWE